MFFSTKNIIRALSVLICLLALPSVATAEPNLPRPSRPCFTVPLAAKAPKIDGYINDKEWADAVSIVRLNDNNIGRLSSRKFEGFIKSDSENLYFAFQMQVPSVERLVSDHMARIIYLW